MGPVKLGSEVAGGLVQRFGTRAGQRHLGARGGVHGGSRPRLGSRGSLENRQKLVRPLLDLLSSGHIGIVGGGQDLPKRGHTVPRFRREVGTPIKESAVRGQKCGKGPSAPPDAGLNCPHIDGVDVRPFLPVHLDVHEAVVHDGGGHFVLEGFPLHDMAPVAGRIADGEENGLVLLPSPGQGFLPPWVPIHRVLGVLKEVGAGFLGQSVRHGFSCPDVV